MSQSKISQHEDHPAKSDLGSLCQDILVTLNEEQGWGLSDEALHAYRTTVVRYLADSYSESQIRAVVTNYHHDHARVQRLLDGTHQQHTTAWAEWIPQVMRILQYTRLAQPKDTIETSEDLTQIALLAIVQALPNFRYASRFSTWAYQVIVQRIQRHFRDQQAAKRAVRPDPLDHFSVQALRAHESEHPESATEAQVLATLMEKILAAHPDRRLLQIFRLWAYDDARVEEIGQRIHLGPARVRVLLNQIRDLLQHHPDIQAWRDSDSPEPPE